MRLCQPEPPRRSPRRIRDPAQEPLARRCGAAESGPPTLRNDGCGTTSRRPARRRRQSISLLRLDEAAKGRRAEQRKRKAGRGAKEADAARAQSNQLLAELMQAQTVASKLREKETSQKRPAAVARGRGVIWYGGRGLASWSETCGRLYVESRWPREKIESVGASRTATSARFEELMRDPSSVATATPLREDAISVWLMTKDTSPKTGCVLKRKLIPNFALRRIDDERIIGGLRTRSPRRTTRRPAGESGVSHFRLDGVGAPVGASRLPPERVTARVGGVSVASAVSARRELVDW